MIYLDNAATSAKKPESVYRTLIYATVNNSINAGRGGYTSSKGASEILFNTRESLSRLFNINNPERIVFAQNTTHALNMAIKGVLSYGDHVIYTSMEHNSVLRPIKALEKSQRVRSSVLNADENGVLDVNRLNQLIRPNTKLICMTHSSNVCGNINEIYKAAEIAKAHGVLFLVDAAQSAGILDIDAKKIDLLAFPGHKGLMAPMGTGGLFVREGITLKTIIEGGTGSLSELEYQPDVMPDMLESGTQNIPAIAGLGAAADFILETGIENIKNHEDMLCHYFEERVRQMPNVTVYGGNEKTAICALNFRGLDCVDAAGILNDKYSIAVRSGLHCAILAHKTLGTQKSGLVRFSFGYFNTLQEVQKAVDAVYEIQKGLNI